MFGRRRRRGVAASGRKGGSQDIRLLGGYGNRLSADAERRSRQHDDKGRRPDGYAHAQTRAHAQTDIDSDAHAYADGDARPRTDVDAHASTRRRPVRLAELRVLGQLAENRGAQPDPFGAKRQNRPGRNDTRQPVGLQIRGLFPRTVRRRGWSERLFNVGLRMLDRSRLGDSSGDVRQSRAGQHLHQGNRAPDGDAPTAHRHAQTRASPDLHAQARHLQYNPIAQHVPWQRLRRRLRRGSSRGSRRWSRRRSSGVTRASRTG